MARQFKEAKVGDVLIKTYKDPLTKEVISTHEEVIVSLETFFTNWWKITEEEPVIKCVTDRDDFYLFPEQTVLGFGGCGGCDWYYQLKD